MSSYIEPVASLEEAWLLALEGTNQLRDGRGVNVITTVTNPLNAGPDAFTTVLDSWLMGAAQQRVSTVAHTLFPSGLYADPGFAWSPDLTPAGASVLDAAANDMFELYLESLPLLRTVPANKSGTYFSRMISWPGKESGGINQLRKRINALRGLRRQNVGTNNVNDLAIAGEALPADLGPLGLQEYAATDNRTRGFPCLVHVDLTLHEGRLSLSATYRHWYVVTKGYGNLLGLARLLHFLAQQTGYEVGELMVTATFSDAERGTYHGKRGIADLVADARAALSATTAAA